MKKKIFICFLIMTLIVTFSGLNLTFADTAADKQEELNDVNNKKEDLSADLAKLEKSIKDQNAEVEALEDEINAKEKQIEKTQKEIRDTIEEMTNREDGLNARLRVMYKNGSVGYIDVLLGSNSISEFISNLEMIKKIYENDMEVLETLKKERAQLEKKKEKLVDQKKDLAKEKAKADEKKAALDKDKAKLEAQIDELNRQAEALTDEIFAMQDPDAVYDGGILKWPTTSTYITSKFGYRLHPVLGVWKGHTGIDIGVSSGSPVYAASGGKVILAQWYGGYGYAVIIDHGSGLSTLYGHNSRLLVDAGDRVSRGEIVARSGSTGISTGPHLHFEVRVNGVCKNPMKYL